MPARSSTCRVAALDIEDRADLRLCQLHPALIPADPSHPCALWAVHLRNRSVERTARPFSRCSTSIQCRIARNAQAANSRR